MIIVLLALPSKALFGKVLLQCIGIPTEVNLPDASRLEVAMAIASVPLSVEISKTLIEKTFCYDWGPKFRYDATRQ